MDLSFTSTWERDARDPARRTPWSPDLSVLLATAAALQAACPTTKMLGGLVEDKEKSGDWIQALADLAAPNRGATADIGLLGGSFHPRVAQLLAEGQL